MEVHVTVHRRKQSNCKTLSRTKEGLCEGVRSRLCAWYTWHLELLGSLVECDIARGTLLRSHRAASVDVA